MHDRASANEVAMRTAKVLYQNLLDIDCFSHMLDHVGEHNNTVNSPNCRQFGTQASVLYSESVPYSGVRVISSPIHVVITVIMLFDIKASRDII